MTGNTQGCQLGRRPDWQSVQIEDENGRLWERGKFKKKNLKTSKVYVCELNILDSVIGSLKKLNLMMVISSRK